MENCFKLNQNKHGWYVDAEEKYIKEGMPPTLSDLAIAELLLLPFKEYEKTLLGYNAHYVDGEYYFKEYSDGIRCVEHLNDTYGIIIILGR